MNIGDFTLRSCLSTLSLWSRLSFSLAWSRLSLLPLWTAYLFTQYEAATLSPFKSSHRYVLVDFCLCV